MSLVAVAVLFAPGRLWGQAADSSFLAYLRQSARPLSILNGQLQGAGAVWLQAEAELAQFVLLGEDHGLAENEILTGALWRALVPLGFRHLAIEEGPWLASFQDRYVRSGHAWALEAYRSAVLPASPPASVEHLALLKELRQTTPTQKAPVIWGLDQERRAVPLLSRLVALAPTAAARSVAEASLVEAQQREAAGHYLLDGYADQIDALRRAFASRPSNETTWILSLIARSNRIYDDGNAPAAEKRGYLSNQEREEMMKDAFLENYRVAQRAGERQPRVLLRVGSWHGMRGYSPTRVSSLANFAAEFAKAERGSLFNIVMTCADGKRSGIGKAAGQVQSCGNEQEPWITDVRAALTAPMTVFDLRPLRAAYHAGVAQVPAEVVPYVFSYDALLVVSRSSPLHYTSAPGDGRR